MEHRKPTLKCELEEWKDIVGYEGLYQVSNKGRIRSLSHLARNNVNNGKRMTKGRVLTPYSLPSGYLIVKLSKNEKEKSDQFIDLLLKHSLDSQITELLVTKAYSDKPRAEVKLIGLDEVDFTALMNEPLED